MRNTGVKNIRGKKEYKTKSAEETTFLAGQILDSLKREKDGATVIFLRGNLGAGKTTFMKGVAEFFGIKETVLSPTFVLLKVYEVNKNNFKRLIHIDAYRLESGEDLEHLGWEQYSKDSQNIIFIEWPEKVEDRVSQKSLEINFEFISEDERLINVK